MSKMTNRRIAEVAEIIRPHVESAMEERGGPLSDEEIVDLCREYAGSVPLGLSTIAKIRDRISEY